MGGEGRPHSALMPANLTTFAHFSASSARTAVSLIEMRHHWIHLEIVVLCIRRIIGSNRGEML